MTKSRTENLSAGKATDKRATKKAASAKKTSGRLTSIDRIPLHEHVYRQLKDGLMNGRFEPGETLSLRSLAHELNVSVMPVREAVHRLVIQQAFDVLPNRNICIPIASLSRYEQLIAMRKLLEGQATADTAERITEAQLKQLRELNTEIEAAIDAGDREGVFKTNRAFHFAIYSMAGNEYVYSAIETCWIIGGPYLVAASHYRRDAGSLKKLGLQSHKKILAALRKRDPDAARKALIGDIEETEKTIKKNMDWSAGADDE